MMLIDSNILLRYFTNDLPHLASRCGSLFQKIAQGKESVLLNHLVIAEVVWVLETQYHHPDEKIFDILLKLINTPNIKIPDKELLLQTLVLWHHVNFRVDYIDAYNAAWVTTQKLEGIYSYDTDYDRLKIQRQEP